jgi:hypothetical protein
MQVVVGAESKEIPDWLLQHPGCTLFLRTPEPPVLDGFTFVKEGDRWIGSHIYEETS